MVQYKFHKFGSPKAPSNRKHVPVKYVFIAIASTNNPKSFELPNLFKTIDFFNLFFY
jgi:hypothetical protein